VNKHLYLCHLLVVSSPMLTNLKTDIKFHYSRSSGAELFHADGRTDMTELIVAFRNFANAPKKLKYSSVRRSPIS